MTTHTVQQWKLGGVMTENNEIDHTDASHVDAAHDWARDERTLSNPRGMTEREQRMYQVLRECLWFVTDVVNGADGLSELAQHKVRPMLQEIIAEVQGATP